MSNSGGADQVGRVLGGRYRLVASIGTGASAQVYVADDVSLRRRVAVKVLHAALAEDEAFLRRFRAEAQAVAAMQHPNVLAVYDWGEEGREPYLVTEYLGGGSLRGMLEAGRRLTPSQALLVGLEAARGLEYAHRRGFVHRDIKPANLLFDEEGRLRIADFGIARALAEAAWTEPQGAVLGTARYASPEQAQGRTLDGASDVYSLALVLVEAVTGSVPFVADTTIGTLMARIDRQLPVPDALGPMQSILQRCGRPDPADRPDGAQLAIELMAAAEELPAPGALPLVSALDEGRRASVAADDPTLVRGAAEPGALAAAPAAVFDIDALDEPSPLPRPATRKKARRAAKAARREVEERRAADRGESTRRRRRWPWVLLAVVLTAAAAGGGYLAWDASRTPTHLVPNVDGRTAAEARAALEALGFRVGPHLEARENGTEPGEVIAQAPASGERVEEGAVITLTVSLGNELVAIPNDLVGMTRDDAEARLASAGLVLGEVTKTFDEVAEAGNVIRVDEVAKELPKGDAVDLVVSDGPTPRTVPDVAGKNFSQAKKLLADEQLTAAEVSDFSETVKKGVVIRSEPAKGAKAARGSTVRVIVSKGPRLVAVPNVFGMDVIEAGEALEALGLVSKCSCDPTKTVTSTDPAQGTMVAKGTKVTIFS